MEQLPTRGYFLALKMSQGGSPGGLRLGDRDQFADEPPADPAEHLAVHVAVVAVAGVERARVRGLRRADAADVRQPHVRPAGQLPEQVGHLVPEPVGVLPGELVEVLLEPPDRDAVAGALGLGLEVGHRVVDGGRRRPGVAVRLGLADDRVPAAGERLAVRRAESGFEGKIERKFKVEGVEPSVEGSVKVNRKNIAVDQEKFEEGALKLCTPDELGQVYNGAPLKVWLDIHLTAVIAEVPAADAALLQGRANELGSTLGDFAIIALYKQGGDGPATRITELPEGMSPLRLNWSVPQELRASGRTFGVMSVHDGEVLEHASDVAGEEVGFDVAKLSTFTLTHKDAQATDSGSGGSGSGGSTAQPQRTTAGTTTSNATTGATKLAKTSDRMASTTFVSAVAVGGTLCLAAAWLARCRERS